MQRSENAEIAQLVEHNLAKVGVASSSLVFRSKSDSCFCDCLFLCQDIFAEIAQLVEHNLAKVGVASSSLVFRSKLSSYRNVAAFFVDGARLGGAPLMLPFQGLGRCEEYKKA